MIQELLRDKKKLTIVIAVVLVILVCLFVFMSKNNEVAPTEVEQGAPPSVALEDKDNKMYAAFTEQYFSLVRGAMTSYIVENGGDGYTETIIINKVTSPYREGTATTIEAVIKSSNREVVFVVDLPTNGDDSTFSVPAENYKISLLGSD